VRLGSGVALAAVAGFGVFVLKVLVLFTGELGFDGLTGGGEGASGGVEGFVALDVSCE
jgi:hypothetical protein